MASVASCWVWKSHLKKSFLYFIESGFIIPVTRILFNSKVSVYPWISLFLIPLSPVPTPLTPISHPLIHYLSVYNSFLTFCSVGHQKQVNDAIFFCKTIVGILLWILFFLNTLTFFHSPIKQFFYLYLLITICFCNFVPEYIFCYQS